MRKTLAISDENRAAIRTAVQKAEARTSGEIFTVVAMVSDDYRIVPLLWATLVALLVPLPFFAYAWFFDGWSYPGAEDGDFAATTIYATQLGLFIVLAILLSLPQVRPRIVPRSLREERAHALAIQQFLAHGLHMTEARTGVLIFVSLRERYAEIVADDAIDQKVDQALWERIMETLLADIRNGRLAEGLIAAVGSVGSVLGEHFPPEMHDRNELVDDLVLI